MSPSLFARVDLEKYRTSAALLRNFFVNYQGGVSSRPGTRYCETAYGVYPETPRLIPFIVADGQAYVAEFGTAYVRLIANGAYVLDGFGFPLTLATPYAWYDLPLLKFSQSANVMTLTHDLYPIYDLTRVDASTFTFTAVESGPTIAAPSGVAVTTVNNTDQKSQYGYVVTSVSASGEESLPSGPIFIATDILEQSTGIFNTITWTANPDAVSYRVYKCGPSASGIGNDATPIPTTYGFIGQAFTNSFVDNNIAQDYGQAPPQFQDPFSPGQVASVTGTGGTGYSGLYYGLSFAGGGGTGAAGYGLSLNGNYLGVVLTNPGKGYTTPPTVTDIDANTVVYTATLGQLTGTYPGCVSYFQQRRVFGGTRNFPQALVFSKPGQYTNFDTTPVSLATDAITASVAGREVNAIRAMVPMNTGLVVFTSGGGFLVSGGSPEAAITASNVSVLTQAASGINNMPPIVVNYDILYCQAKGACVRDLAWNFYVQTYTGTDRSVLASHLFKNQVLREWAYSEEPFRLVQLVRGDGHMNVMTYVPEQEIFGWTQWDTNGFFRSIATIPEGNVNATYVLVERYVGGARRYTIERFDARQWEYPEDSWCLDSALSLPGTFPSGTITIDQTAQTVTNTDPIFSAADIGKTLWALGGKATVTGYVNPTVLNLSIERPFPRITDDPYATTLPIVSGFWELDANVTTVTGLSHLNGFMVSALADGIPVPAQLVTTGTVTLPFGASKVICGLAFQCQFKTMKLDLGDPTVQGRRKNISAVTMRTLQTLNIKMGSTFADVYPVRDLQVPTPVNWVDMDQRALAPGTWNTEGVICIQQDDPLPVTILGLIPEVTVGDNGR